ncbi:hypothetical protein M8C21_014561 [Ambrosia artemisiifolia]|uniref:Sulfotransferase n=1 Tax=Ambrosia artemisiifolia TaxID=4212 RepID=A0AAD5GEP0_AMBAR|nr:hypothetical protein M8C21_014561 [Ambrosia artemisiifolia]
MEEILKTLPEHTCSWLTGKVTLYKYQDFWGVKQLLEGGIRAQQSFRADPSDIFLCSFPKTSTTWLKSLAFAIVSREKYDKSTSPLLTSLVHECVPFLERDIEKIEENHKHSNFPLVATHLPYTLLPQAVLASNCKIVYIYRNTKDVIVSLYHFLREALKLSMEDAPFEEAFDEFCQGICGSGPYWDHILGYWKASIERPERILFLKYEDLKREPSCNVKRLGSSLGTLFQLRKRMRAWLITLLVYVVLRI